MEFESEIFKKYKIHYEMLEKYGFNKEQNNYIYKKSFLDDAFTAIITIENNKIIGKVIDNEDNLEYINFRIKNQNGAFSTKVKEEYEKILINIRDNCFEKIDFINEQSNRISKLIYEKYNVLPEFLWEDTPTFGVFRNKKSKKWFGLIMNINASKLKIDNNKEVEIINIKVDDLVSNLINTSGIFEAYHMNKKKWISILLSDILDDDKIMDLIDISYNSVTK